MKMRKTFYRSQIGRKGTADHNDGMLTIADACKLLKCSERKIWDYIKSANIPYYEVGNEVFFEKWELQSWTNCSVRLYKLSAF